VARGSSFTRCYARRLDLVGRGDLALALRRTTCPRRQCCHRRPTVDRVTGYVDVAFRPPQRLGRLVAAPASAAADAPAGRRAVDRRILQPGPWHHAPSRDDEHDPEWARTRHEERHYKMALPLPNAPKARNAHMLETDALESRCLGTGGARAAPTPRRASIRLERTGVSSGANFPRVCNRRQPTSFIMAPPGRRSVPFRI